ncbi:LysR family transcriptional regulator [Caproiciproducens galactitolivorans]|uniref:LysR family transcriptional regulator n=1 Tax=Caproiciproducens galactitolivorans TaxID=642589 RepID=UPI002409D07F|nr:LysR family transcriptional regulator [Caproiciproducens galactitolivorans]
MNLKQLKYFMAIAEERQITAAAKKLHIAQPPLSYQLSLLEQELGVTLIKRGPRNAELTDAGKLLYKRAEQILSMTSSAVREVENYGKGLHGVLSLGAVSSSGGVVPNLRMQEFTKHYPDIRFEIHEGNTFAIIEMLEKGIVDLGIVRTPFQYDRFHCRYSALEPMAAVMTKDLACGQGESGITLEELKNKPLIIYRRFEALIQEAFAEEGLTPFICCLNDDARTTYTWARKGFGIGIIPKSALQVLNLDQLICKDILNEKLRTQVAVIWEKKRYLSPLAQRFVSFFEDSVDW